jgi:hypothetical protein
MAEGIQQLVSSLKVERVYIVGHDIAGSSPTLSFAATQKPRGER